MNIETTINITESVYKKLKTCAELNKISKSKIITMVIKKINSEEYVSLKINSAVQYQENESRENWKRIHVNLSNEVYEIANDLRKFTKKSVSFIISSGIKKYLDKIIRDTKSQNSIEYFKENGYFVRWFLKNDKNCFKIVWGLPENIIETDNYPSKITNIEELKGIIY